MKIKDRNKIMKLSKELLSCPTAPFHERKVLHFISNVLSSEKIPYFTDSGGNLIVRLKSGRTSYPIAFVAHADHPGFHVIRKAGKKIIGQFLGGVDLKMMLNVDVHFFTRAGRTVKGKITGTRLIRGVKEIQAEAVNPDEIIPGDFGMFAFPGWKVRKRRIYSRAIDDLLGCAAILNVLIRLSKTQKNLNLYGIFTRAEEIGFIGANHVIAQNTVPPSTLIISVESSQAYSFAKMGSGPILRTGDKASLFSPEVDSYFKEMAERLSQSDPTFHFQRLLMAGGTCEATPFSLAGYRTYGIAFPLGNYHNMSPARKISPEFVDISDFLNGILLMESLAIHLDQFQSRKLKLINLTRNSPLLAARDGCFSGLGLVLCGGDSKAQPSLCIRNSLSFCLSGEIPQGTVG
ncbi:MAG: hypothetical protein ACHQYP_04590 [Nitrospiria bacterium]